LDMPALPFAQDEACPDRKAFNSTDLWHTMNGT
jgi:hypothetical protein